MSGVVVTGVAAWTAAGRGAAAVTQHLARGQHAFVDQPPYDDDGLVQPRCAIVADLDRADLDRADLDRAWPARQLLDSVARAAIDDAGLAPDPAMGIVVGTSSGDLTGPWERWHRAVLAGQAPPLPEEDARRQQPTAHLGAGLARSAAEGAPQLPQRPSGPRATVSLACASGTAAFALALGWLEEERCPAVLVAGVDALSLFVHAGFAGLGALAADLPRPFHADRDGLLLGEGAAALLLEREDSARGRGATIRARVLGVGLSGDGAHMTAPDREGGGAARAMQAALADAGLGPADVDTLSVHGTGTVFNDAMEARALRRVFGATAPPLHGVKQAIGHTLGAAGAIEAAVLVDALGRGERPPPPADPDPALSLPSPRPVGPPRITLSTSSAFGGANAALLLGAADLPPAPPRPTVQVERLGPVQLDLPAQGVDWRALWPDAPPRFFRVDPYARLGMLLVQRLLAAHDPAPAPDTGIVLGTRTGCRIADLQHHARLVAQGAAFAHRAAFAATVPGTPAGEASIHWGLRGPALVLLGEEAETIEEAARLVRRGRARSLLGLWVELPERGAAGRASGWLLRARAGSTATG